MNDVYWSRLKRPRGEAPAWVGECSNGYSVEIEQTASGYSAAVFHEGGRLGGVVESSLACAKAAGVGFVLGFTRAIHGARGG